MHLEILCEEPSAAAALNLLMPRILAAADTFRVLDLQCKSQLLAALPARLRAYAQRLCFEPDLRVLVLIDRDRADCKTLKQTLEQAAQAAGLQTLTAARPGAGRAPVGPFQLVSRVVCEELEAWFLGDPAAVEQAYPNARRGHFERNHLRDPDNVKGGTWEALQRTLRKGRYYPAGLAKIQAARDIAPHLDLARNVSPSFQAFVAGVRAFSLV